MPEPKKQTSKSKGKIRKNANFAKKSLTGLIECQECGEKKLPHQACQNCGYYKDEQIVKDK
jgi:large subunit ribosomal protein L32